MKHFFIIGLLLLSSCTVYTTPVVHQADLQKVDFAELLNKKRGVACRRDWWPFSKGSNSIFNAAMNAEISKVEYVEYEEKRMLFGLSQTCVYVFGE